MSFAVGLVESLGGPEGGMTIIPKKSPYKVEKNVSYGQGLVTVEFEIYWGGVLAQVLGYVGERLYHDVEQSTIAMIVFDTDDLTKPFAIGQFKLDPITQTHVVGPLYFKLDHKYALCARELRDR